MAKREKQLLGVKIKSAIKQAGISQTVIAEKLNLSRQAVNQLDTRKKFDFEFLQDLKDATGLDFTNYVFNPKLNDYVPMDSVSLLKEPESEYKTADTIELSLSIKINADQGSLSRLSDLIASFKGEATKYGFTLK
ncbi:helix-turn-helix transcriptional regulator [Mucilaginibacter gossypii]|uniref:helix-turn-helix domain-containing protein n=1 Tax=Mucilaginibacter gossypii TaxID=551996 RepID=UPI000DCD282B|nr:MULTISPECIES: helix-turn-helix transcriptional regulator [Mucilaginibacter]QTE38536.1 helix-turn-helix transcriptional regulator [Mucilaginibacter gossypii]RAV55730.1 hypothetical protein DIU36_16700 [Mucilaginibacter rubeus]